MDLLKIILIKYNLPRVVDNVLEEKYLVECLYVTYGNNHDCGINKLNVN